MQLLFIKHRFAPACRQGAVVLLLLLCSMGCKRAADSYLLERIPAAESGIDFVNNVQESDTFNVLSFHYLYNGGGVGVGDFNNDGLQDAVLSGNQSAPKLYLNQGDLRFAERVDLSSFSKSAWLTGVSIVDINADGWMDIYFSVGGPDCRKGGCTNLLLLHQGLDADGQPQFQEAATDYGLADSLYNQQAVFFTGLSISGSTVSSSLKVTITQATSATCYHYHFLFVLCNFEEYFHGIRIFDYHP